VNNYDLSFAATPQPGLPWFSNHKILTPYPYQQAAVQQVSHVRKHSYCAHHPGAGKTPIALMASITYALTEPVIVICPPSIVYQWARQANLWTGVTWLVAANTRDVREFLHHPAQMMPARFIVPDSLTHEIPNTRDRFHLIIADEAHRLKTRDARRTRAFFGHGMARGLRQRADKVLCLSGTPMPNNPTELYPFLHSCFPEIAPNFAAFANRYCPPEEVHIGGGRTTLAYKNAINKGELAQKLRDTAMIRPLRADILAQLPPLREDTLPIKLGIKDGLTVEEVVNTWNHGDPDKKKALATARHHLGQAKAEASLDYLATVIEGGDAPVIWCWHREVCEMLAAKLEVPYIHGGTTPEHRRDAIDLFCGGARAIVVTIQAASEGIDGWQSRTDLCIFIERDHVPKSQEQAIARLWRIGQRNSVRVVYVNSDHPIDYAITANLERKQSDIAEVVG